MKYLLLIYRQPGELGAPDFPADAGVPGHAADERAELTRQAEELHREITESGEFVVGTALAAR